MPKFNYSPLTAVADVIQTRLSDTKSVQSRKSDSRRSGLMPGFNGMLLILVLACAALLSLRSFSHMNTVQQSINALLKQLEVLRRPHASYGMACTCPLMDKVKFMVINLDRRPDRLDTIIAAAADKPWIRDRMCRVPAVDGRKLPDEIPESIVTPADWKSTQERTRSGTHVAGKVLTMGAVALTTSHGLAWSAFLEDPNAEYVVVMEDDVANYFVDFDHEFCKIQSMHQHWEMLQFQGDGLGWHKNEPREDVMTSIEATTTWNTAMYMMTRAGAAKALGEVFPVAGQMDNPDGPFRSQLQAYAFQPPIAQASALDTDVQQLTDKPTPAPRMLRASSTPPMPLCSGVPTTMTDLQKTQAVAKSIAAASAGTSPSPSRRRPRMGRRGWLARARSRSKTLRTWAAQTSPWCASPPASNASATARLKGAAA